MTGLNLVGDDALHPVGAAGEHIDDAEPFAALIPAPSTWWAATAPTESLSVMRCS